MDTDLQKDKSGAESYCETTASTNSTNKLKCVIFDLDGTLFDTARSIMECIDYSTDKLGYPRLSYEQKLPFIGPPLMDSYMKAYGCSEEEAKALILAYREHYGGDALLHVDPYEGISEMLQGVQDLGLKAAVATNKPQIYADRILKHFGFDKYMSVIHGADLKAELRKPDLIRLAAKDCGAELQKCIMVGDTEHDARGAAEAGVPFLAVTYGFANMDEMLRYPNIGLADSPAEVLELIRERGTRS